MDISRPFLTTSPQETSRLGEEVGHWIKRKGVGIVCLYGELGSGKTTFAQGFAKALGVSSRLPSPTFIIVRRYPMHNNSGFLYHIDLFRVAGQNELVGLGLPEILTNPDSYVLVEWAEKLGRLLPKERIDVQFSVLEGGKHRISICKTS